MSNTDEDTIRRTHAVPISALQHEYLISAHDVEPLLPVLEELGVGFVAYSPLTRGFRRGTGEQGALRVGEAVRDLGARPRRLLCVIVGHVATSTRTASGPLLWCRPRR
ncbi:aldo/keto reductase [Streptomyces sp. Ncost-T10-10d]|uniref:aldo/keto reductase n=1 Tax=Streptomyces sp. Ncost-T10-10d TaxID=1839774 RepID=UPI001C401458